MRKSKKFWESGSDFLRVYFQCSTLINWGYRSCMPASSIYSLVSSCTPLKKRTWLVCSSDCSLQLVIFSFLSDLISDDLNCWCFYPLSFPQQHSKIRSWLWLLYVTDRDSRWPRAISFSSNNFILEPISEMQCFFMYPLESWGEVLGDHAWIYSYS